jgi:hypothetical protein
MGIKKFYQEMQNDFYLYGQVGDDYPEFELSNSPYAIQSLN